MEDNFLAFWFRFIYKYSHIIEIKRNEKHIRYDFLKEKSAGMLVHTGELKNYEIEYKGFSMADM